MITNRLAESGIVKVQFSKEAAVILENHTLEIKVVFPRAHRYYWALKSIAVQNFSETVTTLYYTAFAFRILLNDLSWWRVGGSFCFALCHSFCYCLSLTHFTVVKGVSLLKTLEGKVVKIVEVSCSLFHMVSWDSEGQRNVTLFMD